jgi:threonine/homoserine/homoserine lactone efflux protein
VPIIVVILMVTSSRARQNGPAFLLGWVVGLTFALVVVIAVAGSLGVSRGTSSPLMDVVKLALGLFLLALAARRWRRRRREGEPVTPRRWLATVDEFAAFRAFGLGVLLSAVNPMNLAFATAAALAIAEASLGIGALTVVVVLFVLIGSGTIVLPVAYSTFGGESARRILDGWKAWLGVHDDAVMAVVLIVLGMLVIGKGIGPLIG